MVARRNWTRTWWLEYSCNYSLVTSEGVIAELMQGEYELQSDVVALMDEIKRVSITDEIAGIIDVYLENHLMPRENIGDALHLALASYYKCDFLLTWCYVSHYLTACVSDLFG